MNFPFDTIPELFLYLDDFYKKHPGRIALQRKVNDKYEGITFTELKQQTETFALGLAALGIKTNDKVALLSENRPEWVYADLAILGLGAIDVPLYPSLTAESIEFILNNSDAKAIIVSNKLQLNKILKIRSECPKLQLIILLNEKDIVENEPALNLFKDVQEMGKIFSQHHSNYFMGCMLRVNENNVCTIIYTSGTTGEPKGVMLSHKNILSNVKIILELYPINKDDIFLSYLPLCHIFERMAGYYTAFATGGVIYYAESIESVANNIVESKPTIITTVPRLFERIYSKIIKNVESQPASKQKIFYWAIDVGKKYKSLQKRGEVSVSLSVQYNLAKKLVFSKLLEKFGGNLRFFISGGAPLSIELGEFFEAIGVLILEGYGLTETSPVISFNAPDAYKFGSVGKPLTNMEVKLADDGEILVKGPNVMLGYFKNVKETLETLKNGWLHTGDIGTFDSDGFLFITDRKKSLFKTSTGKYIAPAPIENLFLSSKYIDQVLLIGDKRIYITALIVPDYDFLKSYAQEHNLVFTDYNDLINNEAIKKLYDNEVVKLSKQLANWERVRKYRLISQPFTIETGELTPSLKIKKKVVEERYKDLIEEMYKE